MYKQEIICDRCGHTIPLKRAEDYGVGETEETYYMIMEYGSCDDYMPTQHLCKDCWDTARIYIGLGWD